eukprot:TRINITY_DN24456_c0_g1_i1.p1 TRINITY_DN24456_c0_g1~~TRINITY_DN24456_c0_g1_i1.p1  ORF type:complete len:763 (-),score=140.24 TRINITY_DN24456_c0_g1_i1:356-2644(-)
MAMQAGLLVCLFVLVAVLDGGYAATNPWDVQGLISLYTNFGSPTNLTGWSADPNSDPCGPVPGAAWQGVICQGPAVTQISIPSLNLQGSIQTSAAALQGMQNLITLDISFNNIASDFPNQLPSTLQNINIAYNSFYGSFPSSISLLVNLVTLDVRHNIITGSIPDVFGGLMGLTTLDFAHNEFSGQIPGSFAALTNLRTLNLQENGFNTELPLFLENLPALTLLNVSTNHFIGDVPPGLLTKPGLQFVYDNNQFTQSPPPPAAPTPNPNPEPGVAPSPLVPLGPDFSPPAPPESAPTASVGKSSSSFWSGGRIAGIVIAAIAAVIVVILIVLFFLWRNRESKGDEEKQNEASAWFGPLNPSQERSTGSGSKFTSWKSGSASTAASTAIEDAPVVEVVKSSPPEKTFRPVPPEKLKVPSERVTGRMASGKAARVPISATAYSVADLQAATNSFGQESLIGEGALGRVYRGEFPNGKVYAVKKLDTTAPLVQNEEDFLSIVASISRLRHSNITELVGYCAEHGQRLLVYEYVSKGTLNETLHSVEENTKRLSWNQRVKIALGAARALEYLHEVCLPAVVHRNFKSANILLDDELNPHLSDCGIAALTPFGSERQVSAQMLGSFGYSAPEYAMSGIYTVKSDVYSFGVVMLELLTGRKPLDSSRTRSEQSLVRWATPQLHDIDALAKMVDPALKGIYPAKSLSRFADIIALCVQPEPEFRPPMSEVVQALVRLMQRASLSKRRSGDDIGSSQRSLDRHDISDSSA